MRSNRAPTFPALVYRSAWWLSAALFGVLAAIGALIHYTAPEPASARSGRPMEWHGPALQLPGR